MRLSDLEGMSTTGIPNTRKNAKTAQSGSPHPSPNNKEKQPAEDSLEGLANMLRNISAPSHQKPQVLCDTEPSSIEIFFKETGQYIKDGGSDSLLTFIDQSLLEVIREFELEDPVASESKVLEFLKGEGNYSSAERIHACLDREVGIDLRMSTGKLKLQSLFLSLKKTLEKMNLKETADEDEYCYSFKQKKKLVLSKLPLDFQEAFQTESLLTKKPTNVVELYKQLIKVEKGYSGEWGDGKRLCKTRYEKDISEFAKEYRESINNRAKTRSMHP